MSAGTAVRSAQDSRALARGVESEQPELAHELRGIALHREAFDRTREAGQSTPRARLGRPGAALRQVAFALWRA